MVEIDHFGCRHSSPCQSEEILNDRSALFCGLHNLFSIDSCPVIFGDVHQQQLRIPRKNSQNIIQIMSHFAGQLPEHFHFFRTIQTVLQFLFFLFHPLTFGLVLHMNND